MADSPTEASPYLGSQTSNTILYSLEARKDVKSWFQGALTFWGNPKKWVVFRMAKSRRTTHVRREAAG